MKKKKATITILHIFFRLVMMEGSFQFIKKFLLQIRVLEYNYFFSIKRPETIYL